MTNAELARPIFVYGTLKRGERNEAVWPRRPSQLKPGWVHGSLFHRSDYPAMQSGTERVLGELWFFKISELETVLRALDRLEGTHDNHPDDLYHRVELAAFDLNNQSAGIALAYHYVGDPEQDGFVRINSESKLEIDSKNHDENQFLTWTGKQ